MYFISINDIRLRVDSNNMAYLAEKFPNGDEKMLSEVNTEYVLKIIANASVSRLKDGRLLLKTRGDKPIQIIVSRKDEELLYLHFGITFFVNTNTN